MYARKESPHPQRRLAFACGRLAPPPELDLRSGQPPTKCVNQFQRFFLSELILHHNGNGNVSGLVNASDGTNAAQYEYGPFGEMIRCSGVAAKTNIFRFSTKSQDDECEMSYYGHRYYSAPTGRWL